jgi:O-antigen ligase
MAVAEEKSVSPSPPGPARAWRFAVDDDMRRMAAMAITIAAALLVMITLRPFGPPDLPGTVASEGDPVNQYGFLLAGCLAMVAIATLVDRRVLGRLVGPGWAAVGLVLILSFLTTAAPMETMRSVLLTVIAMTVALAVVLLPRSERDFRAAFTAAALCVLALAYFSVVAMPSLAVHQASGPEAHHAGLWRGHYTHKNIAGPVMSVLAMFGLYCYRAGDRLVGGLIVALAMVFVVQTGSKTTLGFVPIAMGVVLLRPLFGRAGFVAIAFVLVLVPAFMLTVGTVLSSGMAEFVARLPGDPTYTGRTSIWSFAVATMADHPTAGYGFYNFWQTPFVTGREADFEQDWDVRGIGSGHSNYIDMPLLFGFAGAAVIFWVLLVAPTIDYVKACRQAESRLLADYFMMVVVFMALSSLMETFMFNRSDSFWLLIVMAVFGLRLLGRTRLRQ